MRLEETAVSHKFILALAPFDKLEWCHSRQGQDTSTSPTSPAPPQHTLPLSKCGSKEKSSEEPDSYDGVCSPAVLVCLPWWEELTKVQEGKEKR